MKNKLLEELEIEVKKLELKEGNTVVIKDGNHIHDASFKDAIEGIVKIIPKNQIIVLNNETSIESIPEKEMNKLGWYKKDNKEKTEEDIYNFVKIKEAAHNRSIIRNVIYSISTADVQHVAEDTIQRYLTPKELEEIKRTISRCFPDWQENIKEAILEITN